MLVSSIIVVLLLIIGAGLLLRSSSNVALREKVRVLLDYVRFAVAAVEQVVRGDDFAKLTQTEKNHLRVTEAMTYVKAFATTIGLKWNPTLETVVRGAIEWEVRNLFSSATAVSGVMPLYNSLYTEVPTSTLL